MSPEERARETMARRGADVSRYLGAEARGEKPVPPPGVEAYMAEAIRAAEEAAYERAAKLASEGLRYLLDVDQCCRLADYIRSLSTQCPNCENGSGYTRRVGRDNEEIVENCDDHRPVRSLRSGGAAARGSDGATNGSNEGEGR